MDNWEAKQRLARLEMLIKSMSAEEVATELINVLSLSYGITSHLLVASREMELVLMICHESGQGRV